MINKKAMSGVVTSVIMIALVLAATAIVWSFVSNMLQEEMDGASACMGNFDKVVINNYNTCYDTLDKSLHVSVSVTDLTVDGILVSISGKGMQKSFTVPGNGTTYKNPNVKNYDGNYDEYLNNIEQDSGYTYIMKGFDEKPGLIEIAPTISGKRCEVSSRVTRIDSCQ